MLFQSLSLCFLISSTLAAALSNNQPLLYPRNASATTPHTSLNSSSALPTTGPRPNQTIGDYFDSQAMQNSSQLALSPRGLAKTRTSLTSKLYDGHDHYNISIQTCVTFDTVVGTWTFLNSTTKQNATLLDINQDLLATNLPGTRVLANANLALAAGEASLKTAICGYTPDHDELRRKLLQHFDGYYAAILMKASIAGAIAGGFYGETFTNHTQSVGRNVAVGAAGVGLAFMFPLIDYVQRRGYLTQTEASVLAAYTAWYRALTLSLNAMRQMAPNGASLSSATDCLPETEVEIAVVGLGWAAEAEYSNDGVTYAEGLQAC